MSGEGDCGWEGTWFVPLAESQSSLEGMQESMSQQGRDEPEAGRQEQAGFGKLLRASTAIGLGPAVCVGVQNVGRAGFCWFFTTFPSAIRGPLNTAFTFVSGFIFTRPLRKLSEHPSHFSCQDQPPPGCTVLPLISSSPGSCQGLPGLPPSQRGHSSVLKSLGPFVLTTSYLVPLSKLLQDCVLSFLGWSGECLSSLWPISSYPVLSSLCSSHAGFLSVLQECQAHSCSGCLHWLLPV